MTLPLHTITSSQVKESLSIEATSPLSFLEKKYYLPLIQALLEELLDLELFQEIPDKKTRVFEIYKHLPLVYVPDPEETKGSLGISFLVPSEFTEGASKYVSDTLSRWLLPGKKLDVLGHCSLHFRFSNLPSLRFCLFQTILKISSEEEALQIQKNLYLVIDELKMHVMAVYRARYIARLRSYNHNHQKQLLQEVLRPLFPFTEENIFEQLQAFITKISSEEKIHQVRQNLAYLMENKPKTFDRDIFHEMRQHVGFFSSEFLATRNQKHISRLIAYHYLFKKILTNKIEKDPKLRHLSLKISPTFFKEKPIVFLLLGMNFLQEMERFDIRHLQNAINQCISKVSILRSSCFTERPHEKMVFFYLEIHKKEFEGFDPTEIRHLRKKLPKEILRQIETVVHPIFMPRNEEDLLRNLLNLSREIQYLRDLPQASIHYEKQTNTSLSFILLLVRAKLKNSNPLHLVLQELGQKMKIDVDDIRIAGYLKKKYPKEAAILRVTLHKKRFFRSDYSLDLLKARQAITENLLQTLGDFRDFNGGLIIRQAQALDKVREEMGPLSSRHELFLENYFYSLRPVVLQTIWDPVTIAKHFILLLQILDAKLQNQSFLIHRKTVDDYELIWIQAAAPSFKEALLKSIGLPSQEMGLSFLQIDQWAVLGLIIQNKSAAEIQSLLLTIQETLSEWQARFACPLK